MLLQLNILSADFGRGRKMKVFVSGSLAYDRIMDFPGKFEDHILPDKIHVLNVSFVVNGLTENFGGTAGNIAFNLSMLGVDATILSAAGKDFDRYAKWLSDHGIDVSQIRILPEEFTAGAYITTDMADNQITGFNPGAMKYPSKCSFIMDKGASANSFLGIVAPGNAEDMLDYSRKYKELKIPFIFDPGQQIPALGSDLLREMTDGADILISNDYELDLIKKITAYTDADLLERTRVIITTLGEKGSVLISKQGKTWIPAAKAGKVVDPTGAGDAFRAGLIKGLAMDKDLSQAARMGAVCGAYAVECYGTQAHVFTEESFWIRYNENFA
jgi:adenosine kinase